VEPQSIVEEEVEVYLVVVSRTFTINTIDYVTISTTGNAFDFGD
jgi:hypothetical protein